MAEASRLPSALDLVLGALDFSCASHGSAPEPVASEATVRGSDTLLENIDTISEYRTLERPSQVMAFEGNGHPFWPLGTIPVNLSLEAHFGSSSSCFFPLSLSWPFWVSPVYGIEHEQNDSPPGGC